MPVFQVFNMSKLFLSVLLFPLSASLSVAATAPATLPVKGVQTAVVRPASPNRAVREMERIRASSAKSQKASSSSTVARRQK